jgi:hypothetical protein
MTVGPFVVQLGAADAGLVLYRLFTPMMFAWPPDAGFSPIPIATKSLLQLGAAVTSKTNLAGKPSPPPGSVWKLKAPVAVNCVP